MKILVTGCYGFIASHFIKRLINSSEHHIIGVSRNTYQVNRQRLEGYEHHERLQIAYQDLNDPNIVESLEDVDVVVNFAAKTFVDYSVRDTKPFFESNVLGTHNLLEAVHKYTHIKKFVQISTDEVYGPLPDDIHGWKESATLNPTNPYSATKAASDMLCMGYCQTFKIPLLITRTENNYGPYQHPQKVIPNWVRRAMNNQKLQIYGDGLHKRMWLRVEDNVRAIQLLIEGDATGIYHIAGSQEMDNITLARMVLSTLGRSEDMIEFIDDSKIRPNHDRRYGLDTSKISNEFGWAPRWGLSGIEDAVRWFRDRHV